jgi:hypothetical protein
VLLALGCDEPAAPARIDDDDEPETIVDRATRSLPSEPPRASEACASDLAARTPPEVRATLGDLGYDTLFDDACIATRAEADHDPAACDTLGLSTLRDRCRARVAVAAGRPSDCPAARATDGRDPLCVALAARDRRLCDAAGILDGAICEAALGRDRACARLPDAERDACAARAADLAPRIEGEVRTTPALTTAFTITLPDGSTHAPTSAARGARITWRSCVRVLVLGDPTRLAAPFAQSAVAFAVVATDEPPLEATLSVLPSDAVSTLSASVDGIRTLHASGGTISLTRLDAELGGVVSGTFHAAFAGAPAAIDGTFTTFVRDLDPRPAECGEAR